MSQSKTSPVRVQDLIYAAEEIMQGASTIARERRECLESGGTIDHDDWVAADAQIDESIKQWRAFVAVWEAETATGRNVVEMRQPKPRVLIIDDDPHILRAVSRGLERLGWSVVVAGSPEEAAGLYMFVDVVLSDWRMPHGGGGRVISECPVPVVVHTGSPEDALVEGVKDVVRKGSPMESIARHLRTAMMTAPDIADTIKDIALAGMGVTKC